MPWPTGVLFEEYARVARNRVLFVNGHRYSDLGCARSRGGRGRQRERAGKADPRVPAGLALKP